MKNKSSTIPMGMVFKKFYCHKCGELLSKHPTTRIVKKGDPDYKKHSRINHVHVVGDVEVTEYNFECLSCSSIFDYDEQCDVQKIQKKLNKKILSDDEIINNKAYAERINRRNLIIGKVVFYTIAVLFVVLMIYFKSGGFSFNIYY